MPTQGRPFLSNFLAAFRAHSAIPTGKATASSTSSSSSPSQQSQPSQPRTITTSTSSKGATTTALTSLHSPRTHSTSPLSTSPGPSSSSTDHPTYGPHTHQQTQSQAQNASRYLGGGGRRGSDSSSEGFRDVRGAEKWYIGGRTAGGEEKYFKLGVVRRQRSGDRLSLDNLSL